MAKKHTIPGFMVFGTVEDTTSVMNHSQVGDAFCAALAYLNRGEAPPPDLEPLAHALLNQFIRSIDAAREKHEAAVENGRRGAETRHSRNIEKELSVFDELESSEITPL